MPTYTVTDPTTGKRIKLTGDSPPTEAELEKIFAAANPAPPSRRPTMSAVDDGALGVTFGDQARTMGWHEQRGNVSEFHAPEGSGLERNRPDNSLLGMPPELVATGAVGVGRAAMGASAGWMNKAQAAVNELGNQAAPAIKYEVAKTSLEAIGVPPAVAVTIALVVSGYKRGGSATDAASTVDDAAGTAAATETAEASARTLAAGTPAAASPRLVMSPQRIQNELGLAARRAGANLTEPEYAQAAKLVTGGVKPAEAIAQIAQSQMRLVGEEAKVFGQLTRKGMSVPEALKAIEQQRALAAKLGGPSVEEAVAAVGQRNATGRWGDLRK